MELLDIVDENGVPTGEIIDREEAHKKGVRHRTSHVWVARVNGQSDIELLIQVRSRDKDSHPGKLDISSAGHIPAGATYTESAVRELSEELGITASEYELHFCGKRRKEYKKNFHGSLFWDNQVSNVYLIMRDIEAENITYQKSEISDVLWMPLTEVYRMVEQDARIEEEKNSEQTKSCIALEEMQMLRNYIADHLQLLLADK